MDNDDLIIVVDDGNTVRLLRKAMLGARLWGIFEAAKQ